MNTVTHHRGRPDARATEALNHKLLATATQLFAKQGYAGSSMEQIASAARVGKQTLYRRYATKESLFHAVVKNMANGLLESATIADAKHALPLARLREIAYASLELISTPACTSIYRILIAESQRFPGLVDQVMADISQPIDEAIRGLLKTAQRSGVIRPDCKIEETLRSLTGITTGWALQRQMLGQAGLSNMNERKAFFDEAWSIFLAGIVCPKAVPAAA